MIIDMKSLVSRFNDATRQAMEGAAGLCLTRTHYEIDVEHFLTKALEQSGTDLPLIAAHFEVSREVLDSELRRALDQLKIGSTRGPVFSSSLVHMFTEAWSIATLNFGAASLRTGHALLALLSEDGLSRMIRTTSRQLARVPVASLLLDFDTITAGSLEAEVLTRAEESQDRPPAKTPMLDQYTVDLTRLAREGRIDPVIGRDAEIRQIIDVLLRRRQNNPILTGEAGVGKTAVAEGLALRIAAGEVPAALAEVRLHSLDLALLQAGASVKGEFENRLKGLVQEAKGSLQPVILFIDEAHTIIGAGAQPGQGDAANILKPALARGELRTLAATTWAEYKRYFEKDAALARRFQVIRIDEPSETVCDAMLNGMVPSLEGHHGVRVLDEAISAAVRLSHRYLPGRQLPDKAVSVLDTACARVALSQHTQPAAIDGVQRRITTLEAHKRVLLREQVTGALHQSRIAAMDDELQAATAELRQLSQRWREEGDLVRSMGALHRVLEASTELSSPAHGGALAELEELRAHLRELQRRQPLTHLAVDAQVVASVIAEWTGIPLGRMMDDEITRVLNLETELKQRVIGQDHALGAIAQRVWTSRAQMEDPVKPLGVFMLVGPSGVGKTETALALADLLYGGEENIVTINMSEFQEPHSVSTLKGAPPGYVGYGEGGVLTEAVRRQPYSVVLLDEIEKAHPDVLELFFQVFDKGRIEDGEGRSIDFRNTLILLTTNAASDVIVKLSADPEAAPLPAALTRAIRPELNRIFKPAFLGRTLVVPFYPVRDEVLRQIIRLKLKKIESRLFANHRVTLTFAENVVELIQGRCLEAESGARNIDHLLSNTLLPEISRGLLVRMAEEQAPQDLHVDISPAGDLIYQWSSAAQASALAAFATA